MKVFRYSLLNKRYLYALQFWIIFSINDFETEITWITVFLGFFVGWLFWVLLKNVLQYNNKLEPIETTSDPEKDSEDETELSPDYQLPYFSDESDFENDENKSPTSSSLGSATSGYNTDPEIDLDWEYFKLLISVSCEMSNLEEAKPEFSKLKSETKTELPDKILHAPPGPVPLDQVYLTFSCQITGFYVKAIVDKNHSMIHILNYEKLNYGVWCWTETNCSSCIRKVRKALDAGGCMVPFAMDLEEEYHANSESEDTGDGERRKKIKVSKERSRLF